MGVAGDIGFGLGIILREWWLFYEVHGVGISRDHPGELIFDSIDIAPRANSDDYLEWLIGYLKFHKIDVLCLQVKLKSNRRLLLKALLWCGLKQWFCKRHRLAIMNLLAIIIPSQLAAILMTR